MNSLNRITLFLALMPAIVFAMNPPTSSYGTVRETMLTFDKADPITIEAAKKYSDFFCGDLIYDAAWKIR